MSHSFASNGLRSSLSDFGDVDRLVMRCSFDTHNHFGKLFDERVYEADLAERLRAAGITQVCTQIPISVTFRSYSKTYYLDLSVVGVAYELKAVAAILPAHEAQAIHYAALLGLNRIKLLNFGADRVEGRLLGTPFANLDRHEMKFDYSQFIPISSMCEQLAEIAESMFRELGGYLSVSLYRSALAASLGGERQFYRRLPVQRDGRRLGSHPIQLHAENCCFILTTLETKSAARYAKHLERLLHTLPIKAIQWINTHQRNVCVATIYDSNT